jgi:hypothetical protein
VFSCQGALAAHVRCLILCSLFQSVFFSCVGDVPRCWLAHEMACCLHAWSVQRPFLCVRLPGRTQSYVIPCEICYNHCSLFQSVVLFCWFATWPGKRPCCLWMYLHSCAQCACLSGRTGLTHVLSMSAWTVAGYNALLSVVPGWAC